MEYRFTEEEELLRKTVRNLAKDKIGPIVPELERKGEFSYEVLDLLKNQGLLALHFPSEYGGTGGGAVEDCIIIEELGRIYPSAAITIIPNTIVNPLIAGGNKKYRPRVGSGNCLDAICLTEPSAGSDAASIKTRAIRQGDHYVLSGTKIFITNGGVADIYCIVAVTDPEKRTRGGITNFVVEPDYPGFSVGKIEDKMGLLGSSTAELILDEVTVPRENVVGEEGEGFKHLMYIFDGSRIGVGAAGLGIAQGALDLAIAYAQERVQFGKPIKEFQGLQFMLADMAMQIEAARALIYKAAVLFDQGDPEGIRLSSIAKCLGADAAMRVTTDAVQIFGGYGYMRDYRVEMFMRDAKGVQIFEGTNQIQRVVTARYLFK